VSILTAIRAEERRIQKRISDFQSELRALQTAADALNGNRKTRSVRVAQKPVRHRRRWSAAARKRQSQKLKAIWANKKQ
jgi:hypothetical protein